MSSRSPNVREMMAECLKRKPRGRIFFVHYNLLYGTGILEFEGRPVEGWGLHAVMLV